MTGGTVVTDPWEFGVMVTLKVEGGVGSGTCSGGDRGGETEGGIMKGVASSNKNEEQSYSYSGATFSSDVFI